MDLNEQHLRAISGENETPELGSIQVSIEEVLLKLSERLIALEERVTSLEKPQLMYRRPNSNEHEKLSETLNYLHNSVEDLKRMYDS